jgi:hypothetical protein
MAGILTPPVKPRVKIETLQRGKKYFTIQTTPNHVFTLKSHEEAKTSVVGFKKWDDAFLISKMIETHYIEQKEWPVLEIGKTIVLPSSRPSAVLRHLYIQEWDFEELKFECTRNIIDFMSIERIINKKSTYSFNGHQYTFSAPVEFYMNRFDELYDSPT